MLCVKDAIKSENEELIASSPEQQIAEKNKIFHNAPDCLVLNRLLVLGFVSTSTTNQVAIVHNLGEKLKRKASMHP